MKISIITPTSQVIGWNNPADVGISRIGVNTIGFGNGTAADITAIMQGGSLALGGATIGSNAIAWTGTANSSGNFTLGSTAQLLWSTDLILTRAAAATLQFGAANSSSPVAQTIQFQNGSGTNIPAVNAIIIGPLATGNAANGDIVFKTGVLGSSGTSAGTATTALTIKAETQDIVTGANIQLIGTTSSFPMIKRNAANVEIRLADDSAQTSLLALGITLGSSGLTNNGDTVFGATTQVYWSGRTLLLSSADGILKISNNAQTDFGRIQLGGSTSSFPSIKRSSAALAFRLADDSADANITAASPTFSSSVITATAALATSATDGFVYIPSCNGTPTGVPTGHTGTIPIVYDYTNNYLYVYNGGAWKKSTAYS